MPASDVSVALNRFGLGGRGDEPPPHDPRGWLGDQLTRFQPRPPAIAALPGHVQIATEVAGYLEQLRQARQQQTAMTAAAAAGPAMAPGMAAPAMAAPMTGSAAPGAAMTTIPATPTRPGRDPANPVAQVRAAARHVGSDYYIAAIGARADTALTSTTPFAERLVHFWANHFAVSADRFDMIGLIGNFEFEAIRPHVLGNFRDMLSAVERHPAMLLYLDQAQSVGPNSAIGTAAASRGRQVGLNENLAREIMELHTLGVRTGYSQADVTEFARALTGWTVQGLGRGIASRATGRDGTPGDFTFADRIHEPGARTIVGKHYPEGGEAQAQAVLDDLAASPATAQHIATKLARHFAGDTPPPAMVARLQQAYLSSHGDLPTVYRALIASPEAWVAQPIKFKNPWDWSISAMRALDYTTTPPTTINGLLNQLGQPVWKPGSPAGYDDMGASWAAPDAVLRRVEVAQRLTGRPGAPTDARALAPRLFPATLSDATAQSLTRAESPSQAMSLLLVSPEMMRR